MYSGDILSYAHYASKSVSSAVPPSTSFHPYMEREGWLSVPRREDSSHFEKVALLPLYIEEWLSPLSKRREWHIPHQRYKNSPLFSQEENNRLI